MDESQRVVPVHPLSQVLHSTYREEYVTVLTLICWMLKDLHGLEYVLDPLGFLGLYSRK